ncbi:MAG: MmgE/PrpD family protein [Lentisphaerae bacterium]|nr:MmgE/PrpD family protein [Lentisphaerota bacterium]MBT4819101.1 MmgE/PrpD family protein [Lentisphaerota bacterium]MBT5609194.1 MmgE/PrpD family protein [Lentisphaerota bacterium]MBT7055195.1 MmgE/PrpD family protein [Lentisphaerota bacterium]MBT7847160.1 MmgE/PrpD family protein [Lentisphaerota bacterium]
MTYTEILTDIGLNTRTDDITPSAFSATKKMVLDSLGCAIAAKGCPGVADVLEQLRDWGGKAEATVLLFGDRIPAPAAIFANATLIHALDYDDIHIPGTLHIMSIILPTALAAAEMGGASGREMLAAVAMGVEVAGRLGTVARNHRRGGGFLPSSLDGGFGAVATASRLLGLTPAQCVNAMGINYAQTSGNRQALHDMTLTKRIQPALAARAAMFSVALARRGFTGAHRALEGKSGYFKVYLDGTLCEPDELSAAYDWYQIERLVVKRWTSCGACHSTQAAAERLVREENVKPDEIDRVELFGCGPGGLVGNPFEIGDSPQVDAQFNVAYGVALALLRGAALPRDYADEAVLADTEVVELTKRITYIKRPEDVPPEPERPVDYPRYSTGYHGLVVHTKSGRRLMRAQCPAQTFAPGADTFESVLGKFRECAVVGGGCSPERTEAIIEEVRTLDTKAGIDPLLELLVL